MTMEECKTEVLKYHPEAICMRFRVLWFVMPSIERDTGNDILGSGEAEADAWEQAALNAARMS